MVRRAAIRSISWESRSQPAPPSAASAEHSRAVPVGRRRGPRAEPTRRTPPGLHHLQQNSAQHGTQMLMADLVGGGGIQSSQHRGPLWCVHGHEKVPVWGQV
jgi:hypothetical protein